ncbi:hypothetical protein BDC45DRAFT_511638 [Circinella umbellata]|nr:hypothetical protein BDC45DRAFT_511638 [Circinella umbellata]
MFSLRSILFLAITATILYLHTALSSHESDNNIIDVMEGQPIHAPLPPGKRFWIFDDLPILMNWKLFYTGMGLTAFLWLTGSALRKWEDNVDQGVKLMDKDESNEEETGLIRDMYDQNTSNNKHSSSYGAVIQQDTI